MERGRKEGREEREKRRKRRKEGEIETDTEE